VLLQHRQQVTVERLIVQLQSIRISISKRQVVRLLIMGQDSFLIETVKCCGPACRRQPELQWTILAHAVPAGTALARRSATTTSPGSAQLPARAD
jgi:hypothetical protein